VRGFAFVMKKCLCFRHYRTSITSLPLFENLLKKLADFDISYKTEHSPDQLTLPDGDLAMMTVPIVLDIEASGFGAGSYPIEVGFSRRHGEGWCTLVRPENDWQHWDESAAMIHKIPRETLIERGRSVANVAESLNQILAGHTVYTDGWAHDYVWLAKLYDAAEMRPHFRLADFREIISPKQEELWHITKSQIEDDLNISRHRASNDARILQLTWLRTFDASRLVH